MSASVSSFPISQKGTTTPLRAYPLPSLTLVVLFPSRVYNLQFASIIYISLLPDLPKTGNHQKSEPNVKAFRFVNHKNPRRNRVIERARATGGYRDPQSDVKPSTMGPLRSQTHGEIRHAIIKQQGSQREPCCFAKVRGSAPLRGTFRKGAVLDELTQKTLFADKNRAAALQRFTHESDHLLSLGLHQGNPGGRGSGVWIVLSTPVRHFHQDWDEIETFFSQDILLFSLIFLRELFHQNALLFQMSETAGENVGRHAFF